MVDPGALVQGHVTEPSQAPVEAGLARVEETALLRAELKHAPRVTPQVRSVNRGLASGRRTSENHQSTDDETRVRFVQCPRHVQKRDFQRTTLKCLKVRATRKPAPDTGRPHDSGS